jgi:hypothetical protein
MAQILACAKKFDPAAFIGESWSAAEEDERADRLAEIDLNAISLANCLKTNEQQPTGEQWLRLQGDAVCVLGRARLPCTMGEPDTHPAVLEGAAHLCVF